MVFVLYMYPAFPPTPVSRSSVSFKGSLCTSHHFSHTYLFTVLSSLSCLSWACPTATTGSSINSHPLCHFLWKPSIVARHCVRGGVLGSHLTDATLLQNKNEHPVSSKKLSEQTPPWSMHIKLRHCEISDVSQLPIIDGTPNFVLLWSVHASCATQIFPLCSQNHGEVISSVFSASFLNTSSAF